MKKRRFSESVLNEIKKRVSIADIIGEHVVLKRSGTSLSGLCPFHSERTPSFNVNEAKQLYHCYGCKAGGDMISFVMEINGLRFDEAVSDLAQRASVDIPESELFQNESPETRKARIENQKKYEMAFKLNRFVAAKWRKDLLQHREAREYLDVRKTTEESEKYFYIGAAMKGWEDLTGYLTTSKAPLNVACELGLIRESKNKKGGYFDLFRNRVMFPTLDLRGRIVGFGGRLLPSEDSDQPKYINSPDSYLFQKSALLFGLYQAKKFIREEESVILVEGYFDVTSLWDQGIRNVVATCGTALTSQHLSLLKRFTDRIVVLFDGDDAGQQAIERSMVLGLKSGLTLFGLSLPDKMDPDEYVRSEKWGPEKLKIEIQNAKPLLDLKMDQEIARARKSPHEKTDALKKMGAWLGVYTDRLGKGVRVEKLHVELGIPKALILEAMKGKEVQASPKPEAVKATEAQWQTAPRAPSRKRVPLGEADQVLIMNYLNAPDYLDFWAQIRERLPTGVNLSDLFVGTLARNLTGYLENQEFHSLPEQEREKELQQVLNDAADPQTRSIITEALMSSGVWDGELIKSLMLKSLSRVWAQFSQKLRAALEASESTQDAEIHREKLQEYLDVQRKMKEFDRLL